MATKRMGVQRAYGIIAAMDPTTLEAIEVVIEHNLSIGVSGVFKGVRLGKTAEREEEDV